MTLGKERIGEREVGENVPVSIATALAVESACGVHPEIEVKTAPIREVKGLWINLRTMVRNLMGSMDKMARAAVTPQDAAETLVEEFSIIESAIVNATQGAVPVTFYHCTYSSLKRMFPKALLKVPSTVLQREYAAFEKDTIAALRDMGSGSDLRAFDVELVGTHPSVFLVTHLAVDLLSRKFFDKLQLLESHTGAIKQPATWNTKLTNGRKLERMPFNAITLQLFGDGSTQFNAYPVKFKRAVEDIAEVHKWTPLTTKEKMLYGFSKIDDRRIRAQLMELL